MSHPDGWQAAKRASAASDARMVTVVAVPLMSNETLVRSQTEAHSGRWTKGVVSAWSAVAVVAAAAPGVIVDGARVVDMCAEALEQGQVGSTCFEVKDRESIVPINKTN